MAFVDDLTALLASAAADTDILYVGKPGDPDPDRQMTVAQLRDLILDLAQRPVRSPTSAWPLEGLMEPDEPFYLGRFATSGLGSVGTRAVSANDIWLVPFILGRDTVIERLGVFVSTAGAGGTTVRCTVREALANSRPGSVIGSVEVPGTSTGAQVAALPSLATLLANRLYWAQMQPNAAVTLRGLATSEGTLALGYNTGSQLLQGLLRTGTPYASGPVASWTYDPAERSILTPPMLAATL